MIVALFEQYQQPIYAYLVRLVDDREWAEELAEAVLLAALRAADQLPGIPDRRAWLYRIATNTAFTALTRRRRSARLPWQGTDRLHPGENPSSRSVAGRGRVAGGNTVESVLALLPVEQRAPLLLYSHNELSLAEVAGALGIGDSEREARLYRARVAFCEAYEGEVRNDRHQEVGQLLAVYESLTQEQQSELTAHLAECGECARELAAFRRMDRLLRYLPDPQPSSGLQATVREAAAREQPGIVAAPARRPRRGAPPRPAVQQQNSAPVIGPTAEPLPGPDGPLRWQRLLLPVAMVLLFAGSIWLGMRGQDAPVPNPINVQPTDAVVTDTPENHVLPVPPTEVPLAIDASGHVTITFACDEPGRLPGDYFALAQSFQSQNPHITVQLRIAAQAPNDHQYGAAGADLGYLDRMRILVARADVFCATGDPNLFDEGLVRNLTPLVRADAAFALDQFYPAVLEQVTNAGSLYMIPSRFRPTLIRYDPDAFEAAGLRPPRAGWSWDDLLSAATALTQRDGNSIRRWGFGESDNTFVLARFLSATMSPEATSSLAKGDPFGNAEVLSLFEWFENLYYKARAAPVPRLLTDRGESEVPLAAYQAEVDGRRFAMWTDELASTPQAGIRAAPFPVSRAFDKTTPIGVVDGWAISSETQHVEAAWRWISFISQNLPPDPDGRRVPARRSVPQMQEFWNSVPTPDRDAYSYALEHLGHWPDLAQSDGSLQLYTMLSSMIRGEATLTALTTRGGAAAAIPLGDSGVVTLTFAAPASQLAEYEQAAADFGSANPSIRVRVVASEALLPNGIGAEALWGRMGALAERVDTMVDRQVPALVRSGSSQGILYDLTDLTSGTLRPADYYPNTLEALQWQGRSWALPGRVGLYLIHYSQWMFIQMGIAYPEPGWTWDDFDGTVRAVALHGGSNTSWWGFKERSGYPLQLFKSRAGTLVDYSSHPAKPLLDQPAVVQAATWYAALLKDNALAPVGGEADDSAMWVGLTDPSVLSILQSTGIGVVPFPVGLGSTASTPLELHDAFAISARTRHPDVAWQWLVYLQAHQPDGASSTGIPARRDRGRATGKATDAELQAVVEYALEHTQRPAPLRPEGYEVDIQLTAALQRIVKEGQSPVVAMKQAQEAAQKRSGQQ